MKAEELADGIEKNREAPMKEPPGYGWLSVGEFEIDQWQIPPQVSQVL